MSRRRNIRRNTSSVLGQRMAYVEMGSGDPIVFQHGNPTSSYLWRNIMPALAKQGRCIALDLIGMGDSDKLTPSGPDRYTLAEHQRFFDAALGRTRRRQQRHAGAARLGLGARFRLGEPAPRCAERHLLHGSDRAADDVGANGPRPQRRCSRDFVPPAGEDMALAKNVFVERVLPGSILRKLTDAEMAVYRRPFAKPGEDRRPTLTWPRQIPLDGEPADVVAVVQQLCRLAGARVRCRSCSSTPNPARF